MVQCSGETITADIAVQSTSCNSNEDTGSQPAVAAPELRWMKAIAWMLFFPIDGC
jgi:hypothetical protein